MVKVYNDYETKKIANPLNNETVVLGGVVWSSETVYSLRLGLQELEVEALTEDHYSTSLMSLSPSSCSYSSSAPASGSWGHTENSCVENIYKYFIIFQSVLDNAILMTKSTEPSWLPVSTEELCSAKTMIVDQGMSVKPLFTERTTFQVIQLFLTPVFIVISFAFTVPLVLKRIVEEKQQGVKELMKTMGLPNWLHWVGWFFITILISIITISVMVIIVIAGEILEKVDPVILFISLFLYGFSIICFNFAISTFFSNRK